MFENGHYYDREKEFLTGTYHLISSLPRNILNERSPGLFCLTGSVTCRDTSSSMIILSNSMSEYWDNLLRRSSEQAHRIQYPLIQHFYLSVFISFLVFLPKFQIFRRDILDLLASWGLSIECSPYALEFSWKIKHGIDISLFL